MSRVRFLAALAAMAALTTAVQADLTSSLPKGTVQLKSAGPLAFGPDSILFIGDSTAATIYAVATGDKATGDRAAALAVDNLDAKIAEMLGSMPTDLTIADMKVNPATGNVFLSVSRKSSQGAVILRVDLSGKVSEQKLSDVPCSKLTLPNATEKQRANSITSMSFMKDRLFVAGLSNEEFASTLRAVAFPFADADKGTSVEVYHGAHGAFETRSPVRTFTPFEINGEANLLAAYTCTPLVKFPVTELKPGQKVRGTTVAELGNRNNPLDMVVYKKNGKTYVLMANSARGVMKIDTTGIENAESITTKISTTAGLKYETIKELQNVVQLDRFNEEMALVLVKAGTSFNLKSVKLP